MGDSGFTEFATHLANTYNYRMVKLLEDTEIPWYLREHYSESTNYYENDNIWKMVETLNWLSYSDKEKQALLDAELDDYFI